MKKKKQTRLSILQRAEVEQLIVSDYMTYLDISTRYGLSISRILDIAHAIGHHRPRGGASPLHKFYRGAGKEASNGNS